MIKLIIIDKLGFTDYLDLEELTLNGLQEIKEDCKKMIENIEELEKDFEVKDEIN